MRNVLCAALITVVSVACAAAEPAAQPAPGSRQEAIQKTLANINAELQKYGGGSWEEWGNKLAPFREAARKRTPPKNGLRIRGDEWQFIVLDRMDNDAARKAIVHFDRQLKARGIDLIVVPLPGKLSIYPDFVFSDVACDRLAAVAAKRMMKELLENDVEVVDLFTIYRDKRLETQDKTPLYYYSEDTHWRNLAAQMAGAQIAERLKRYDFVQKALAAGNRYSSKVEKRQTTKNNPDTVLAVYDSRTNAYHPDEPGDAASPVVITGDSYSKYNCQQGAHLAAQAALHIGLPLTYESTEGLSSDVPVLMARLQKEKNFLANRKVFVWTWIWMSYQGRKDWAPVDLGQ
jgi:alginate O-acetyltransferase complex protein AlgJ